MGIAYLIDRHLIPQPAPQFHEFQQETGQALFPVVYCIAVCFYKAEAF